MKDLKPKNYLDWVFHGKQKDYGAYVLRKKHGFHTGLGLILSLLLVTGGFAFTYGMYKKSLEREQSENLLLDSNEAITVNEISAAPLIETEPPPPIAMEQPKVSTVKYLTPVAKPDEEVLDEELIPTQEELENTNAGASTQEGIDSIVIGMVPEPAPEPVKEPEPLKNEPFTFVEVMPEFPGGESELINFLGSNLKYPDLAKEFDIEGVVYAKFTITTKGKVKDIEIIRGIGGGCDEEVVRVLSLMPDWSPGIQGGLNVPVSMVVPVNFDLQD